MKARIVHVPMKITAISEHFSMETTVISGATLEDEYHPQCRRPQREGQCPQTGPRVFALPQSPCQCPLLMNGHLMIWEGHSIEWKMCRSVEHSSTCRSKQKAWLCIHTHSREGRSGFTHSLERRLNTHMACMASVVFTRFSTNPSKWELIVLHCIVTFQQFYQIKSLSKVN